MRQLPRWAGRIAVLALLCALLGPSGLAATRQVAAGTITVTVYQCPLGMTVNTLEPEECSIASEGFGLNVTATTADIPPRILSDATFNGTSFVFDELPDGKSYLVVQARSPGSPYTDDAVFGEDVQQTDRGPVVTLTADDPDAALTIYNFGPEESETPTGTGRLTLYKAACPPGFTGTAYFEECFDNALGDVEFLVGYLEAEGLNPGLSGTTGVNGFVSFDVQSVGRYSVVEVVPEGYADYAVVCTDAAGGAVAAGRLGSLTPPPDATAARFGIELEIPAGADIRCDWYNILAADATEPVSPTPSPPPTPVPTATPSPTPEVDGRTAEIIAGSCDEGKADLASADTIVSLTDLVAADGESVGRDVDAVPETSFTSIALSIDELVAEEHAIAVGSVEDDNELVACGDIAGVLTENGDLAVALREVDDAGFAGVAYLSPSASDPDQTGVSLFLVDGLAGQDDEGTPTPLAARS